MWQATPFLHNRKEKTKTEAFLFSPVDFHIPTSDPTLGLMVTVFELPSGDPRFVRLTRLMAETLFLKYYENGIGDRELAFEQALQELNRRLPDLYLNFGRSWLADLTAAIFLVTEDSCFLYQLGSPVTAWWLTERRLINIGNQLGKNDDHLHPLKIFSQYHRAPIDTLRSFCLAGPLLADLVSPGRFKDILRQAGTSAQAVQQLQPLLENIPAHIPLYGFIVMRGALANMTHNPRHTTQSLPATNLQPKQSEPWSRRYRRFVLKLQRFSLKQKGLLLGCLVTFLIFTSVVGVTAGRERWKNLAETQRTAKAGVLSELGASESALTAGSQELAAQHWGEASRLFRTLPKRHQTDELKQTLENTRDKIFRLTKVEPVATARAIPPPPLLFDLTTLKSWESFRTEKHISWRLSPLEPLLEQPLITASTSTPTFWTLLDAPSKRLLVLNRKNGEIIYQFTWESPATVQNALLDETAKMIYLLSGTNVYKFNF